MDSYPALDLSCTLFRFCDFLGKILINTSTSVSGALPETVDTQVIHEQFSKLAAELEEGLSRLRSQENHSNHAIIEACAVASAEDCRTLADSIRKNLEIRILEKHRLQAAFNEASPHAIEGLKTLINEHVLPQTYHLASEIIEDIQSQCEHIQDGLGGTLSAKPSAFVELQASTDQLKSWLSTAIDSGGRAPKAWEKFCCDLKRALIQSQTLQEIIPILRERDYSERPLRHDRISEAHDGTFSWIFNQQATSSTIDTPSSLSRWLVTGESLFWVTGNPGCGKSTLMKFVSSHRITRNLLKDWSGDRELIIVSHYFDFLGTTIQRTLEGLLRSLVWNIIGAKPILGTMLSPRAWSTVTIQSLPGLLSYFAKKGVLLSICFFIDGLDEVDGEGEAICQLIEELASLPYVKLCVSSRRWPVFENTFKNKMGISPQEEMTLHEVNRGDIKKYIEPRLRDYLKREKLLSLGLTNTISKDSLKYFTDQAQGSFLWAVLATSFLLHANFDSSGLHGGIPTELDEVVALNLLSVDSSYHQKMAGYLKMSRDVRCLPAEIFFFHEMGYDDADFAIRTPTELLSSDSEAVRRLYLNVHHALEKSCNTLLEVSGGNVIFMHRAIFDLINTRRVSNILAGKVKPRFDSHLAILEASIAWFKRTRFKSGKSINLQPVPAAVSLVYTQSLSKFHKDRGRTLPDLEDLHLQPVHIHWLSRAVSIRGGYDNVCKHNRWSDVIQDMGCNDDTVLSLSQPLEAIYKQWLYPYEKHCRQVLLDAHDPINDILDLVDDLKRIFEFARLCDRKDSITVALAWQLLDNVEEHMLSMTAREQFNITDISMVSGIYRHLVIEARIEGYLNNKLLVHPDYFNNEYSEKYRSPLFSALRVAPRNCTPTQVTLEPLDRPLIESLLKLEHEPNKTHSGSDTPWIAFTRAYVPQNPVTYLDPYETKNVPLTMEVSKLMLLYGADPEAQVELSDQRYQKWRIPAWFKFLKLAPFLKGPHQDAFEHVFSIMMDRIPTLSNSQAFLRRKSKAETLEWVTHSFWGVCEDNFELPKMPEGSSLSDGKFVFRIFSKVFQRNMDNPETLEYSRLYLSTCFWPDYPDLERQMRMLAPGTESRTADFMTNTSFTQGENTDNMSHRLSTSPSSIELSQQNIEVEVRKETDTNHDDKELNGDDGNNNDEVASVQSIDDDIQSSISSIVRTPHTIAAEHHVGDLLSRHPDVRFIVDASAEIMPKDRLKRNIRRSLKLLYLGLKDDMQSSAQVQILTTRMLKGRRSRTRISERTVNDEPLAPDFAKEDEGHLRLNFHKERAFLNNWLSQIQPLERPEEKPQQVQGPNETAIEGLSDSEHDGSEDDLIEPEDFDAVQVAEDFLMNGAPFQRFLTNLCLSLLPDHLRQIMHLAVWNQIELIQTPLAISTFDRVKAFVERLTGSPWNWWPMESPRLPLRKDYVRMNWKCHCGKDFWVDITPSQARVVERMANNPNFAENHHRVSHIRQSAIQRIFGCLGWSSKELLPVSTPSLQGNQPPTANTEPNNQIQQATSATTEISSNLPSAADDLRILLGVPVGPKTLRVTPIPVRQQPDEMVFPLLQQEYKSIRGRWRSWFSFWQLSHCNFVRFESVARNVVVACGQDLPRANNLDYDYAPKPPQASIPPVHPHIFEAAFNSCNGGKCRNPFSFHDCYEFEETVYIKRIPKKRTPFMSEVNEDPIWGLEARHCISCFHVIFYHLLILIPPFAIWGWWLKGHPDDIQSASIPMTVVLAMISMFWSATGILKQFRGEI